MRILDIFRKKETKGFRIEKRKFKASDITDLLADWVANLRDLNEDLKYGQLERLWARAKDLAQNNPWFRRYLHLVTQNVLGEAGFQVVIKLDAREDTPPESAEQYEGYVQDSWNEWVSSAELSGMSWYEVQQVIVRELFTYGEVFVILSNGGNLGFQIVPAYFCSTRNDVGNGITLGVQYKNLKPVSYFFLDGKKEIAIPAERVIHIFLREYANQVRGYPPAVACMRNLHHLEGFEEAETVAARVAASKMAFYRAQTPEQLLADQQVTGEILDEVSPGTISVLPPGYDIQVVDWQHPKSTYSEFVKAVLRSVASSLGISYVSLANDLESVNYSSARVGLLEEREFYKTIQRLLKEQFLNRLFWWWYSKNYENGRFDRTNISVDFIGRRWDWVDPLKDAEAQARMLDLGLVTMTEILKQRGKDLDEHLAELEKEKKKLAEKNLRPPIWGLK